MEVSDTLQINLKVGTKKFPIKIKREEEIFYRDAEKLINERYAFYANHFLQQGNETYLIMAALDIALQLQKSKAEGNLEPVMATLTGLANEIEGALK